MTLALVAAKSRVMVDVRSKGIVSALDHDVTFTGAIDAITLDGIELDASDASRAIDVAVEASVPVAKLEPPSDASRFDRDKMTDNLRGKDVLDAQRFPALAFRGRYAGTIERGTLEGTLVVRGTPRTVRFEVRVTKSTDGLYAEATWQGTLTDLGVKPYKALFGALKLADWARIRIEAVFAV